MVSRRLSEQPRAKYDLLLPEIKATGCMICSFDRRSSKSRDLDIYWRRARSKDSLARAGRSECRAPCCTTTSCAPSTAWSARWPARRGRRSSWRQWDALTRGQLKCHSCPRRARRVMVMFAAKAMKQWYSRKRACCQTDVAVLYHIKYYNIIIV